MTQAYVYEDDATGWRLIQSGDIPSGAGSPLTTKGDLYGFGTANDRIPVGGDGTVLTADSTKALGVKWAAAGSGITTLASPTSTITVTNPTGPTADVDLPTTGVGAATYGDSTHVAEITVDSRGRLTAASSVAISGSAGAGGLLVLYDSGYLGAPAATLDTGAGGISSGHFCFLAVGYLRSSAAGVASENIIAKFNADSSALYNVDRIRDVGGTITGAAAALGTSLNIGVMPAATATASTFGAWSMLCPAYDGTSNFKTGEASSGASQSVTASEVQDRHMWSYQSTSAISRLALTSPSGANFLAGSRLIVYGLQ